MSCGVGTVSSALAMICSGSVTARPVRLRPWSMAMIRGTTVRQSDDQMIRKWNAKFGTIITIAVQTLTDLRCKMRHPMT